MKNKVQFVALTDSDNKPIPAIKAIPDWYKKAKKYNVDGTSSWKICMAFFDGLSVGYVFLTPCDIEFKLENNVPVVNIKDQKYNKFVLSRDPINDLYTPTGYFKHHFAWLPEWGIRTPKGYSTLYTTPLNNFNLPFLNTNGVIDTDKVFQPGSVPFFLKDSFCGVLPKGTPYAQAIVFKREDWESECVIISEEEISDFKPGTPRPVNNYYRDNLWERKSYE